MPPLQNARQEVFAQHLAEGKTKSQAYFLAGYSADDGNACRLTGKDKVKRRVVELQRGAMELAQFSVYALANKGIDTQTLQSYLGHRSIGSTVRYTELAPGRFKDIWR